MSHVLVIGGGIIGCAAAWELTRRGARVTLAEPRPIAGGASQASAGMLAPHTEGRHDGAMHALGLRSLSLYDDFIATLREEGQVITYARTGSLDVALTDEDARQLEAIARNAPPDAGCEFIDAGGVRSLEPAVTRKARGGLRIPSHGFVDVVGLVRGLWSSASRRGARLEPSPVRGVEPSDGSVRAAFDTGKREYTHAVVAAGAWAGTIDISGVPALPVRPVRGQLLALTWSTVPPRHTLWGPRCYAVPWTDGTLLVGATVEEVGFEEQATAAGVQQLLNAVTELAPPAANAAFLGARVGLRPGTPDDRPIVGRSERVPGLIYATGHYRNGALLAPLTAVTVADLVEGCGLDDVWAPCNPSRFGAY